MFSSYNFNHSFLGITDESTEDGAWSNMDKLTLKVLAPPPPPGERVGDVTKAINTGSNKYIILN